jgi:hypothetical protein
MSNVEVTRKAMANLGKRRDPAACADFLVCSAVKMSTSGADNVSVVVVVLHDRPLTLAKSNSVLGRLRSSELNGAGGGDSPTHSTFNSPRLPAIDQLPAVALSGPASGSPLCQAQQVHNMAAGGAGAGAGTSPGPR